MSPLKKTKKKAEAVKVETSSSSEDSSSSDEEMDITPAPPAAKPSQQNDSDSDESSSSEEEGSNVKKPVESSSSDESSSEEESDSKEEKKVPNGNSAVDDESDSDSDDSESEDESDSDKESKKRKIKTKDVKPTKKQKVEEPEESDSEEEEEDKKEKVANGNSTAKGEPDSESDGSESDDESESENENKKRKLKTKDVSPAKKQKVEEPVKIMIQSMRKSTTTKSIKKFFKKNGIIVGNVEKSDINRYGFVELVDAKQLSAALEIKDKVIDAHEVEICVAEKEVDKVVKRSVPKIIIQEIPTKYKPEKMEKKLRKHFPGVISIKLENGQCEMEFGSIEQVTNYINEKQGVEIGGINLQLAHPATQKSKKQPKPEDVIEPSNSLMVKGLSESTDDVSLTAAFENCLSANVARKPDRTSKGFGFVEFSTIEEAKQSLAVMNGQTVDGYTIKVDFKRSKKTFKTQNLASANSNRLFIGNLSFDTDNDSLSAAFPTCQSARIAWSYDENRSKGFGFVEFASAEEAKQAYDSAVGLTVDGNAVRVQFSDSQGGKNDRSGRGDRKSFGGACYQCGEEGHMSFSCPTGSDQKCFNCGEEGHISKQCSKKRQSYSGGDKSCYNCGESGHISRECPTGGSGGGNRSCYNCGESGHISRDCPTGGSGGGNRSCYNCGESGHISRECPKGGSGGGRRSMGGGNGEATQLFVRNLSYETEESSLQAAFKTAIRSNIAKDKETGDSRGFGFVEFSTAEEAKQALSGTYNIDGRELQIRLAEPKPDNGGRGGGGGRGGNRGGRGGARGGRGGSRGGRGGSAAHKGVISDFQGKKMTFEDSD